MGEIITSSGTMADINPLRYRGYYYDTETGFYYLQSRYYDPVTHRFINADSYVSTGQGILGTNMFAYCRNNPVKRRDASGFSDKEDVDGDGDIYEIEQYGGGGSGGYVYGGDGTTGSGSNYTSGNGSTSTGDMGGGSGNCGGYGAGYGGDSLSNERRKDNIKNYDNVKGASNPNNHTAKTSKPFNGDQQALLDIVKKGTKPGFSMNDAELIINWGKEYGFRNLRIDMGHEDGTNGITQGPHFHIGPYNHIRIIETK